ncbi:MAG: FHA domain-containing protein [Rouxiella aceris]|uniref:FHA domain-containing protein n=1 Tax=Rouxiella aceris TaxID=2703884 RepID=UPI00283AEBFF|nr:FHA domain-containing protein [Rouxiella aceris]MDR3431845.1 FHA domain-containing protein [Rouxiella aceris]
MIELRVLSGLHQGAALPLYGSSWTIGNSEENDLYLSDPQISASHCRLLYEHNAWWIQPAEGEVSRNNGESITMPEQLLLGHYFYVGDLALCLDAAENLWDYKIQTVEKSAISPDPQRQAMETENNRPKKSKTTLSLLVIVALALFFALNSLLITNENVAASQKMIPNNKIDTEDKLRKQLRDQGLTLRVIVEKTENELIVKGNLSKEEFSIVQRIINKIQQAKDPRYQIKNETHIYQPELPFKIVQISLGSSPNIVTDTGQRIFIGDEIAGLRLMTITDTQVEFAGDESIKVNWQ